MPHTIQSYKIPIKHSFKQFFACFLFLFSRKKQQGTQYIVVMITEGDTRQDIQPPEKTGRLLSHHLCLQLQSGEHSAAIPSLPSMVSSVHLY